MTDTDFKLPDWYDFEAGFNIKPNGYFGKGTAEIVKQFQTKAGLGVDGVVGKNTLTKLFA